MLTFRARILARAVGRRSLLRAVALPSGLALLLASCGGGDSAAQPELPPAETDAAADHVEQQDGQPADTAVPDQASPDASADASLDSAEPDGGGFDAPVEEVGPEAEAGQPGVGCITGTFQPYWGDLHAHTSYSDGSQEPQDAFAYARDVAGLDIMVVTDHLEQLYWVPPVNRWGECKSQADAAYAPGTFLADCGYEYGSGFIMPTFQSTGHNNVFFADSLFPAVQTDFHDFYNSLAACASCIGQFNHPGSEPTQTWNNFEYNIAADDRISLFEFNGGGATWVLFLEALDAGWHVSPMLNQDNHSANWGTANDERSGLYMADLTRVAMHDAMSARRTFMTEDKNASIRLMADDQCWMGSILMGYPTLQLTVTADDADAADGFASIELYGPGGTPLGTFACPGQASCEATFPVTVPASTYFVARAIESDGNTLVSAPIWARP